MSATTEEQLLVRRIREGTVIDHIDAGKALLVLKALGITGREGNVITVAMNVPSVKLGKKDIIKIENRLLAVDETNKIALIAPRATINIVSEYRVKEKRRVELPDLLIGVFNCPNPSCVSNAEKSIASRIEVIDREKQKLRCWYCGRMLEANELISSIY
ncbi:MULTISPECIES: aspartate carbamoyltransferase regulatory subunit [Candidatus Nitrosocaldus]|jgi:aspartate carbamoyltransferase regulatory subunit|uniref:Aspartate carbamoyltransferase regulatory chain n=1 Tax=Candidatus Nitrosocaldus cavascurensis TaxID=2058097 RepID=A0A2K5ANQ8_9ARCH|nr:MULTISPECIES: aspartate carbamoyltransferase regulatory subunit [Candidatus Nitrosocaldus]SPC33274.1 Aspartate carbamoyltransferase regulatory chain [Candidatus Nitrosocaldus cavascurensis]